MPINDSTPVADPITAAHVQNVTLHITECIPAHEPRASDPHYKYFNEARTRLAALGKLQCWVCGTTEQIELHHSTVEFAFANGVDLTKFEKLYPEFKIESDEDFLKWIEGEGNLLPLCKLHHTGIMGIHILDYPVWLIQRFYRADLAPAAKAVFGVGKMEVADGE